MNTFKLCQTHLRKMNSSWSSTLHATLDQRIMGLLKVMNRLPKTQLMILQLPTILYFLNSSKKLISTTFTRICRWIMSTNLLRKKRKHPKISVITSQQHKLRLKKSKVRRKISLKPSQLSVFGCRTTKKEDRANVIGSTSLRILSI